jgi:hypothetical protein
VRSLILAILFLACTALPANAQFHRGRAPHGPYGAGYGYNPYRGGVNGIGSYYSRGSSNYGFSGYRYGYGQNGFLTPYPYSGFVYPGGGGVYLPNGNNSLYYSGSPYLPY